MRGLLVDLAFYFTMQGSPSFNGNGGLAVCGRVLFFSRIADPVFVFGPYCHHREINQNETRKARPRTLHLRVARLLQEQVVQSLP